MIEVKNNMYQTFKRVYNGETIVIPPKSKATFNWKEIPSQIATAAERNFISYRKI